MKRVLGFTWVGWLNIVVLQWFCVRLGYALDKETGSFVRWTWVGPVLPLTGWWSDYVFIGRKS